MSQSISLIFPRSQFLLNETVFPPLGILYLASVLKTCGINVQCLDFGLGTSIEDIKYDTVGISFTTPQREQVYSLVKELKERKKFLIAGGAHPTHMPMECIEHGFDIAIRGEADYHLPAILRQLTPKLTRPCVYAPYEPDKIDRIPFPDRSALPIKDYHYEIDDEPATVIMTSRSCYNACTFCAKVSNRFRMQSAQRTVDEILHIYNEYGFKAFMIFDDVFAVNKKRLFTILSLLKEHKFKFRCFGRADNLCDETICEALAELGVVEVGIGVESGSDSVLARNFKNTTAEMNAQAVTNLKKFGIRAKAFLIVGLPGESYKTIEETKQWVKDNTPYDVDISVFQPMPGSSIFKNPKAFDIEFNYDSSPMWYKGNPDEYTTSVIRCGELFGEELLLYRKQLEDEFKRKELLK